MFVEIHSIQNFAPSNLNRDDTGSPKDCEFGGHRRARVSSQCWKRAVREYFSQEKLIPEAQQAVRTKKLVGKRAEMLKDPDNGRTSEQATMVGTAAVEALGVGFDAKSKEQKKTSVLLFLGNDQIGASPRSATSTGTNCSPSPPRRSPICPKMLSTLSRPHYTEAARWISPCSAA